MKSAVYQGVIRHRRHRPHAHNFSYRTRMLYLDLDELDLFEHCRWWSRDRWNLAMFRREDYFGQGELKQAVIDAIEQALGPCAIASVRLLTTGRHLGYSFNPVSFYYAFDDRQQLTAILAQITNTPWRERHHYVLQANGDGAMDAFGKAFHVSPFMPMALDYQWRFSPPGESLHCQMNVADDAGRLFDATLSLARGELTSASLDRLAWAQALATLKVTSAIHWQALKLWLKRVPVYDHPAKASLKGPQSAAQSSLKEGK